MRWRVVSFPEMKRNTSWVRASTSVRRRPSTSALQQSRDEVVSRARRAAPRSARRRSRRTPGCAPGSPTPRSLRLSAGQVPCTTSSDHARPQREVLGGRAEQVRDHVVRHRHHVVGDEVDRVRRASRSSSRSWHRSTQNGSMFTSRCTAIAELMMRRTCPWRGSGISLMSCSSSGTTTPGSRKLAWNSCDVLRRREHVGVAGQVPRTARRARHRAPGPQLLEPGRVAGRAERIERRHARILAPSGRHCFP